MQVKAQKAKAKAIAARDERDRDARAKLSVAKMQDAIGVPLLCPLIDQGIAFFMSNYALGLDQPPMQSEDYHKHLSTHGFHPIIATSMTALGLAGVANICMDANLKREAMRWYLGALKMTNEALVSPKEVKSDNTLLATMLLSVFEATNNDRSLAGWSNHVSGSASLLKMRGLKQFSTPAGRRMYMQTVGLLTMNCMGMGQPMPNFVHEMNKEVHKFEDKKDPSNRFYHLHIAAIDFRAQILHRQITSLQEIVDRALEIDRDAKTIFDGASDDWSFEVESCDEGTPGVFGTYYHVYPHMAAAQTWNWVRYNRIYLHDIIRNSLIAGFSTTPPVFVGTHYMNLLEESTQTLYRMQADILASVPQYLHDTPKVPTSYGLIGNFSYAPTSTRQALSQASLGVNPSSATRNTHSPKFFHANFLTRQTALPTLSDPSFTTPATPRDRLPIIRISGGYSSLWALYIAGATCVASPEAQEYVLKSFGRISAEFGINQAKVLASALRIKMEVDRKGAREGVWGRLGLGREDIVPVYLPKMGPHMED